MYIAKFYEENYMQSSPRHRLWKGDEATHGLVKACGREREIERERENKSIVSLRKDLA